MKILITGGTGFIGQHLMERLALENVSLRIISRKTEVSIRNKNNKFEIFQADLSDSSSLEKAFQDVDMVINLAAELYDSSKFESINVRSVQTIASLMNKFSVKKIIHLSSVGVVGRQYSSGNLIVDENTLCHPINGYEKSKLESEKILSQAFGNDNGRLVMLRPTNVFGDEHPRNALLNFFISLKNEKRIVATENAKVNYVYVKDLVETIHHFIFNNSSENIYDVGKSSLFTDFLRESAKIIGVSDRLTILPKWCFAIPESIGYLGMNNLKVKLRSLSNEVIYSDGRLLNEAPGIYKYGINLGLEKTINFYRSQGKL